MRVSKRLVSVLVVLFVLCGIAIAQHMTYSLHRRAALIPVAPTWTPADLPSLQYWFKGDSSLSNSGETLDYWADSSGNNRHMVQPTANARPYITNVLGDINNKPFVHFSGTPGGSSNWMFNAGSSISQPINMVFLARVRHTNTAGMSFVDSTNGGTVWVRTQPSPGNRWFMSAAGGYTVYTPYGTYLTNKWYIWEILISGVASTCGTNGIVITNGDAGWQASGGLIFGANNLGTYPFTGDLAEFIMTSVSNTPANALSIRQYLTNKYAL